MANWLNQLQSLLGQSRSSTSSSADQDWANFSARAH